MRNPSEGSVISIRTFQKVQRELIFFTYVVIKKTKATVYCPKIVAYTLKMVEFLVLIISEQLQKAIALKFETEIVKPWFGN